MRFLSLSLLAFGPFTGHVIDLSAGDPGLHVVYGHNEAGKSTALRAITGLLYGIPEKTQDAHVHRMSDLRVGAELRAADGSELSLVRRKGRKNTLLAPDDQPLDEGVLRRLLGGVGEALFSRMFGLDHVSLREGGNALLGGKGDVGESLFDASLGGRGIHDLLEALRREADGLFRPRASTPALNAAIKAFDEAKKRRGHESLRPEAWHDQKRALDEALMERERLAQRRTELAAEEHRLTRIQSARKLVARRLALSEEKTGLGDIPLLAADSRQRREAAQSALADSKRELARRRRELEALEQRRGELDVPEGLAAVDELRMDALRDRLAAERKAARDLPKRRGELEVHEAAVVAVLRRLGRAEAPQQAAELVPDVALQARVRELELQHQRCVDQLRAAEEQHQELEDKHAAAERRLAALPASRESEQLEQAVLAAQRDGDLDTRLEACQAAIESDERQAGEQLASLGLWSGALARLPTLPLPSQETIDRFETRLSEVEQRRAALVERREEVARELSRCREELDRLQRAGAVPTEEDLAAARVRRDEGWRLVRRAWKQGEDVSAEAVRFDGEHALDAAFERAQLAADQVADRLRREAGRVEQLASLDAEQARAEGELERVDAELLELDSRRQALGAEWAAAWRASGVDPLSPREMRGWLTRHGELSARVQQLATRKREYDDLLERRRTHVEALRAALQSAEDAPLTLLVERASSELQQRASIQSERQQLQGTIRELGAELERARRRVEARASQLDAWQKEWAPVAAGFGLEADASPAEVRAVLAELLELSSHAEKMDDARRRIASMERDTRELGAEVEKLVEAHAPALASLPLLEAAAGLLSRYDKARRDLDTRVGLSREIDNLRRECGELTRGAEHAEQELAELRLAAGAEDLAGLEAAEQRSERARELDQQLREIDDQLLEVREGEPFEALARAVLESDEAAARGRLADIEHELGEIEEALRGVDQDIGGRKRGLEQLGGTGAADAAADAEQLLARIEELALRYARAGLAARVLRRELERYRDQNQGPIISRAQELFPRLTDSRYQGLRVDFGADDEAVLRCVRADGTPVDVEALSDGTRDQLYLALRVASLERFAVHNEPLPVVLDDILVHFDDPRARAALQVLAGLATRTQVLFFTHHQHLVELARDTVDGTALFCHELVSAGRAA